jgi:hypothetical protein
MNTKVMKHKWLIAQVEDSSKEGSIHSAPFDLSFDMSIPKFDTREEAIAKIPELPTYNTYIILECFVPEYSK